MHIGAERNTMDREKRKDSIDLAAMMLGWLYADKTKDNTMSAKAMSDLRSSHEAQLDRMVDEFEEAFGVSFGYRKSVKDMWFYCATRG